MGVAQRSIYTYFDVYVREGGPGNPYKKLRSIPREAVRSLSTGAILRTVEEGLNDGMLHEEAEREYPLRGRHNDPIYKVVRKSDRPKGKTFEYGEIYPD